MTTVLARLRQVARARWHVVVAGVGACALVMGAWVALNGGGHAAWVGLFVLQGVTMLGLAIAGARGLTTYRRIVKIESQLNKVVAYRRSAQAVHAGLSHPNARPRATHHRAGAERLDAALRHDDLLGRHQSLVDQALSLERRLADLSTQLAEAGDQLQRTLVDGQDKMQRVVSALESRVEARLNDIVGEEAALHNLYRILEIDREMPAPGALDVTPQTLLRLVDITLSLPDDRLVVECGSGASTVWLARACRRAGSGRVVALEHSEKYAHATRETLARHGLQAWADVRTAPLEPVHVGGQLFSWYCRSAWSDLHNVQLLLVDGAPRQMGPRSRYPAFPLLADAMAEGAVVALDDAQRADEKEVGASWTNESVAGVRLVSEGLVGRTLLFRTKRSG